MSSAWSRAGSRVSSGQRGETLCGASGRRAAREARASTRAARRRARPVPRLPFAARTRGSGALTATLLRPPAGASVLALWRPLSRCARAAGGGRRGSGARAARGAAREAGPQARSAAPRRRADGEEGSGPLQAARREAGPVGRAGRGEDLGLSRVLGRHRRACREQDAAGLSWRLKRIADPPTGFAGTCDENRNTPVRAATTHDVGLPALVSGGLRTSPRGSPSLRPKGPLDKPGRNPEGWSDPPGSRQPSAATGSPPRLGSKA